MVLQYTKNSNNIPKNTVKPDKTKHYNITTKTGKGLTFLALVNFIQVVSGVLNFYYEVLEILAVIFRKKCFYFHQKSGPTLNSSLK